MWIGPWRHRISGLVGCLGLVNDPAKSLLESDMKAIRVFILQLSSQGYKNLPQELNTLNLCNHLSILNSFEFCDVRYPPYNESFHFWCAAFLHLLPHSHKSCAHHSYSCASSTQEGNPFPHSHITSSMWQYWTALCKNTAFVIPQVWLSLYSWGFWRVNAGLQGPFEVITWEGSASVRWDSESYCMEFLESRCSIGWPFGGSYEASCQFHVSFSYAIPSLLGWWS